MHLERYLFHCQTTRIANVFSGEEPDGTLGAESGEGFGWVRHAGSSRGVELEAGGSSERRLPFDTHEHCGTVDLILFQMAINIASL